jgi:hypothetical protein
LAARHIALAVEAPVLVETAWCEPGIQKPQTIVPLMARLKSLGADVRYLAMAGPLVDGHVYTKEFYCHRPIDEVAADAARTVILIRQIFPKITVGDIEPVGRHQGYPDWSELGAWLDALREAMGRPLAFLHLDITWTLPWHDDLRLIADRAHAVGVPLGVILNGNQYDLSDVDYSRDVAQHEQQVTAVLGAQLDQVIFQSWQVYPRHVLPETDPSSMTGVVMDYLRPTTSLELIGKAPAGQALVRLTDGNGAPVSNAPIIEEVAGPRGEMVLAPQRISGEVPWGATAALFAVRAQTECSCPKRPVRVVLADFQYAETDRPRLNWDLQSWAGAGPSVASATLINGGPALKISAAPGQALVLNGPRFKVTPGTAFNARFAWRVDRDSAQAGFAALIFFGADENEFLRVPYAMRTTWQRASKTFTNAEGIAPISRPSTLPRDGLFRVRYQGDRGHSPAPVLPIGSP